MELREDIASLAVGSRCLVCTGYNYRQGEVTRISGDKPTAFYVKVDGRAVDSHTLMFLPHLIFGDSPEGRKELLACLEKCVEDLGWQQARAREAVAELQDVLGAAEDEGESPNDSERRLILIGRPTAPAALQPSA